MTSKKQTPVDRVNHPPHYTSGEIETIDKIEDLVQFHDPKIAFHVGTVVAYLDRAPHKGTMLEDLKKAQWYLNRAIERLED